MRWLRLLPLAMAASCTSYSESSYKGDGTLRDHGWYSGSGRYTLDLGSIGLSTRGERRFSLANLPPERLAVGFGFREEAPASAEVHLTLRGHDRALIDETRPLETWLQSSSREFQTFLYCKGEGESWSEAPDTAWGCVFRPRAGEGYTLVVHVLTPAAKGATGRSSWKVGHVTFCRERECRRTTRCS